MIHSIWMDYQQFYILTFFNLHFYTDEILILYKDINTDISVIQTFDCVKDMLPVKL